jgi:hypothetical protein
MQVFASGFGGTGGSDKISRLINGTTVTTDANDMWRAQLPPNGSPGTVTVLLPSGVRAAWLRIWNYNAGALDSSKGVKNARVLMSDTVMWSGQVNRASGDTISDSSTLVSFMPERTEIPRPPLPAHLSAVRSAHGKECVDNVRNVGTVSPTLTGADVTGSNKNSAKISFDDVHGAAVMTRTPGVTPASRVETARRSPDPAELHDDDKNVSVCIPTKQEAARKSPDPIWLAESGGDNESSTKSSRRFVPVLDEDLVPHNMASAARRRLSSRNTASLMPGMDSEPSSSSSSLVHEGGAIMQGRMRRRVTVAGVGIDSEMTSTTSGSDHSVHDDSAQNVPRAHVPVPFAADDPPQIQKHVQGRLRSARNDSSGIAHTTSKEDKSAARASDGHRVTPRPDSGLPILSMGDTDLSLSGIVKAGRRAGRNADMEASWDSLSLFRTSHAGDSSFTPGTHRVLSCMWSSSCFLHRPLRICVYTDLCIYVYMSFCRKSHARDSSSKPLHSSRVVVHVVLFLLAQSCLQSMRVCMYASFCKR